MANLTDLGGLIPGVWRSDALAVGQYNAAAGRLQVAGAVILLTPDGLRYRSGPATVLNMTDQSVLRF